jgi:hypothetical protein
LTNGWQAVRTGCDKKSASIHRMPFLRITISAEWLRHFNSLAVGETAAPAGFFAGERGGGRNATAAKL